ncbi:S41 family peptidase [Cohnella silvisoli]|uniref:S41 family peptidase n=1 Tax=Cohnella silvisoli TaxID=2873699 RepID=A0ABV1L2I6_9BACL|nr:S41 family peptidase [Cohnella silvisoli]MCD9021554.1 hypothetical protein [Cohnella silvisoli]
MSVYGLFDSVKWLTPLEIILCLINLTVLVRYAIPAAKHYRWFDFVPSLGVIISIASVLYGDTTLLAIVFYSLTLIIFLSTLKRLLKPKPKLAFPKRKVLKVIRVVVCVIGIVPIVIALMNAGVLRYNPTSDLSGMSYSKAFLKMNERLSKEYPFGEWKHINWDDLRNKYEPIFTKAEKDNDKDLYYKTLRDYLLSIGDGHIKIANDNVYENNKVFKDEVGGGYGISTVQLDDGKVRVSLVLEGSPAAQNGMKLGAEIVSWDGKTGKEAFEQTTWSESNMATNEVKAYYQGRFMARAPIGKQIEVTFKNRDDDKLNKATLVAYDDQFETLKQTKVKMTQEDLDVSPIEGDITKDGFGYVKIKHFLPKSTFTAPEKSFAEKLKQFQDNKVKGLIIDLRDNPGGEDALAATIAGYFVNETKHYEYVSYYNRYTGKFEINHNEVVKVNPMQPYFDGNIAILINSRTGSSGEGIPLVLKGLPNVRIIGFTSTAGSFGIVGQPIEIHMPDNYILKFPDGRSLNKDKVIQGDADYTRQGGAVPDIKIPLNEQMFTEKYIDGQDVEMSYAIAALKK